MAVHLIDLSMAEIKEINLSLLQDLTETYFFSLLNHDYQWSFGCLTSFHHFVGTDVQVTVLQCAKPCALCRLVIITHRHQPRNVRCALIIFWANFMIGQSFGHVPDFQSNYVFVVLHRVTSTFTCSVISVPFFFFVFVCSVQFTRLFTSMKTSPPS